MRDSPEASEAPSLSPEALLETTLEGLHQALRRERRLEALRRTALLDSPAEEGFDRLTRLASRVLKAPVALVTLVDGERQFFKSAVGLPPPWGERRQTPLSHSFCQHVVVGSRPLVISDARQHPVLRSNRAVRELGVVAYAGLPLLSSEGEVLGSFCVIDHVPRHWTRQELDILEDLTASVMTELELRATRELEVQAREAQAREAQAEAARQRFALLAELSALLSEGFEREASLGRAARLVVPLVAAGCAFDVLEGGRARRVAVVHGDARREEALRASPPELEPGHEPPEAGSLGPDGPEGPRFQVPLRERGRLLGEVLFEGVPVQHLALAREVAHRVALALDNARLQEELREAIVLRDRFLTVASHELRTPLTALRLQAECLRRGVLGPGPGGALLARVEGICRQCERLEHLVESLLDLSQLREGRLVLRREEVDLAALVREVAGRHREQAARAGCALRLRGLEAPVLGCWDALRLEQVVGNLLSNALKYGEGQPVTLALWADAHRVRLTVRDEGIGIAAEDQGRIFERFERAVSEKHYGGLGLGLFIVREIIHGLGGTIGVRSVPGQGSAFTLELPRQPPAPEADPTHRR